MTTDPGFGEGKLIRRTRELLEKDSRGYLAELSDSIIQAIIGAFLRAREEIRAEEAAEREREEKIRQTGRENGKDIGWFPGDCCD